MSDAVDLDFKKEDCHAAIAKPSAEDKGNHTRQKEKTMRRHLRWWNI